MSGERPSLQPVAPGLPRQGKLPLPDPPQRPFVALARESRVGGPVRKLVYMVLASFCPVMAHSWTATGRVKRETLRQACELKKMDNLDTHLRQLKRDGFVSWRRTQGASIFEVRLSPLRVLEGVQERARRFGSRAAAGLASLAHRDSPGEGGAREDAPAVSPSQGGSRPGVRTDSPRPGESGTVAATGVTPSQGDIGDGSWSGTPWEGESDRSDRSGVPVPTDAGAVLSQDGFSTVSPLEGEFGGADRVSSSPQQGGSPGSRTGSPGQGAVEPAPRGESVSPRGGGQEVAAEVVREVRTAAAAGAVALRTSEPEAVRVATPSDRRFKLLEVASDRLFAARARELWLRASDVAVQAQISAAVRYREGHRWDRHAHKALEEVVVSIGTEHQTPWRTVVQRCDCGAVRFVTLTRSGSETEYVPWTLCGVVAAFVTDEGFSVDPPPPSLACEPVELQGWREPLTWSDVNIMLEAEARDGGDPGSRLPVPAAAPAADDPPTALRVETGPSPGQVACPRCARHVQPFELGAAGCVFCL